MDWVYSPMHNPQPGGQGLSIYIRLRSDGPLYTFGQQVIIAGIFHNTQTFTSTYSVPPSYCHTIPALGYVKKSN